MLKEIHSNKAISDFLKDIQNHHQVVLQQVEAF